MADLLQIIDLSDSEQVQLSLYTGTAEPETATPTNFPVPLTDAELAEIRWYFNEYPNDTFGAAKTRAETVEAGLKAIGLLLFQTVFGSSEESSALLKRPQLTDNPNW